MRLHTWAIGIASGALILAVGIQLSGQSSTQPSGPSASPAVKTSAPAVANAGKPAPPRTAVRRVAARPPSQAAFAAATKSLFEETCSECHHSDDPAGGLDVALYGSVESLTSDRDRWELILTKLKAGEMPPEDVLRPDAEIGTLVKFLEAEFARADATTRPDPGRVTARRLNRAEYTNTIRDLLAIEFRADRNFPTDDSGDGFDNIADVLTVSPC
jgi:mono/diheme cytochrome c family protein